MTDKGITTAIEYATQKHKGQYRKGLKTVPYIIHPLNVANILKKNGAQDEVIIAGILHDVVEDTPTPLSEIKRKFGQKIAKLVGTVSEKGVGLTWDERLKKYLNKIDRSSKETKMICAADKIDNMTSMINCLKDGYNIFEHMNAGKEKQIAKFKTILSHIEQSLTPEILKLYKTTLKRLIRTCK